jgi:hypothetical protein
VSHFLVLVVGDDVEGQLAPFQENNNGDCPQEYLAFNDCTEEVMNDWENEMNQEFYPNRSYQDPEAFEAFEGGIYHVKNLYGEFNPDEIFCIYGADRETQKLWFKVVSASMTDDTRRNHELVLEKIDPPIMTPVKEVYANIDEYAEEKGYKKENGRYGYYENPNAKWDWYIVGGRWSHCLKLKKNEDVQFDPSPFTMKEVEELVEMLGVDGKKFSQYIDGYMTKRTAILDTVAKYIDAHWPTDYIIGGLGVFDDLAIKKGDKNIFDIKVPGYCDGTRKQHIDVEGMEAPKRERFSEVWDGFHQKRETIGMSYADLVNSMDEPTDEKPFRDTWKSVPEEFKKWIDDNLGFFHGYKELKELAIMSKDEYVACQSAWCPYALLWNGKWYSRGDMIWFGISIREESQWTGSFRELWKEIPDDAMITAVDCHI